VSLSIVVPTLREAPQMAALAVHLREVAPGAEVLVVDAGSDDGTLAAAKEAGLRVVTCAPGRAEQMNRGAAETSGDALLFLHADTVLPFQAGALVSQALATPGVALGAFGFRFDQRGLAYRFVEFGARLRNRLLAQPYGDQGLFLSRATFEALGGFADMPIMEDLDLVLRARRRGRVLVLSEEAVTSSRRYEERGVIRLMLRHWWLAARFRFGWRPSSTEGIER
jgi:rSAM/selenodomain-associated transferase 2